jgi:uncharacterized protein (DUF1810 family)
VQTQIDEFARFVSAQARAYEHALRELTAGRKESHWMWFIFPQLRGLGHSEMSRKYSIVSLRAARRFLAHEILGQRLRECAELVVNQQDKEIESIFGYVDALKFHSCMTLFSLCSESGSPFSAAIDKYFGGSHDGNTLRLLRERGEMPRD